MAKKSRRVAAASTTARAARAATPKAAEATAQPSAQGGTRRAARPESTTAASTTRTASTPVRRASRRPDVIQQRKNERRVLYEKQRRQWLITRIVIGLLGLAVLGGLAFAGFRQYEEWRVTRDVETYFGADDFVGQHVSTEPLLYEQIPPVGGVHNPAWQNCGFYPKFINSENGVHSMEHGAVWITYDPTLSKDQIDILEGKTDQQFVLVSPYPGMDAPVVASVWGKQIKLDGASDDRLDSFIREYRKNPDNSPEPQGICWSGISATTDTVPQQQAYVRPDPNSPPIGGIPVSQATATAQALAPATPPASPAATPTGPLASPPAASPVASPGVAPGATPVPAATPVR